MATETAHHSHDTLPETRRRLHLSAWVKKLTNFRNLSSQASASGGPSSSPTTTTTRRRHHLTQTPRSHPHKNSPYGHAPPHVENQSGESVSTTSSGEDTEQDVPPTVGARSVAPTVSTDHEGSRSIAPSGVASLAGTGRTTGGIDSRRGGDSTFSSPAPSVRSLTTTLTTIQSSVAPGPAGGGGGAAAAPAAGGAPSLGNLPIQFHQPFPTTPASAIPPYLAPVSATPGHPTTYQTATANNLLTDNASILTLASSSKRRRRRSLDTDASVRALAPSSLWGGSRESLPLSVLSASVDLPGGAGTPGLHQSGSSRMIGGAPAERTSIYSTSAGPSAPLLQSERNSFYARSTADGHSGHARADAAGGSGFTPLGAQAEHKHE